MAAQTYTVHRVFNGEDTVLGKFSVENGSITYASAQDRSNCDIFPEGEMSERTKKRLETLLDNEHKSVYITRG